ncbi:hypothetical protein PWR63_21905 [Paraburkholderia sp. A2WS-5]|uniref:hypothetical protein n=1 Tax=unclassified Paraburkholderia TaxID=2615204 RepID=UPI003B80ECBE
MDLTRSSPIVVLALSCTVAIKHSLPLLPKYDINVPTEPFWNGCSGVSGALYKGSAASVMAVRAATGIPLRIPVELIKCFVGRTSAKCLSF